MEIAEQEETLSPEDAAKVEAFEQQINATNIKGLWQVGAGLLTPEPTTSVTPHLWPWADIQFAMQRSAEILSTDAGAERRAFMFQNPGLAPRPGTTQTMAAGFQLFYPGESADSHQHSASAIRFVTEGSGAYTTVGGDRCSLNWGDLVVTPSNQWHDHGNEGTEPVGWLDVIDIPFVFGLQSVFYRSHPDGIQQVDKPADYSWKKYGAGFVHPTWDSGVENGRPSLLKWDREPTVAALRHLVEIGETSPFDGASVEYTNPLTGGHCLPTLACGLQLLAPGEHTRAHRHTSSTVYTVHEGEGHSIVGGTRLNWKRNDAFVVPSWAWHEHVNESGEDAILFSVSDSPIYQAMGLYQESEHPDGIQAAG